MSYLVGPMKGTSSEPSATSLTVTAPHRRPLARARSQRIAQWRACWHLENEPVFEPDEPTDHQVCHVLAHSAAGLPGVRRL